MVVTLGTRKLVEFTNISVVVINLFLELILLGTVKILKSLRVTYSSMDWGQGCCLARSFEVPVTSIMTEQLQQPHPTASLAAAVAGV